MPITLPRPAWRSRRRFLAFTAVGGAAVLGGGVGGWRWLRRADLMKPGPLGEQALGSPDAPVTLILYASLTCPHCAHFQAEVFPELEREYIRTGTVRYILREFPFDALGLGVFSLARCVEKDKYFAAVQTLFGAQEKWLVNEPLVPLRELAGRLGFTETSFNACLSDQRISDGIMWVRDRAAEYFDVNATPTFFINRRKHVGEMPFAELERHIRAAMPA